MKCFGGQIMKENDLSAFLYVLFFNKLSLAGEDIFNPGGLWYNNRKTRFCAFAVAGIF